MSPWSEVMSKWKAGKLHSGSKSGPPVKNQAQAVAIMESEKAAAQGGKAEYQSNHPAMKLKDRKRKAGA